MQPTVRFARDVARLTDVSLRFGIAVSGGPDSMALLWLAHMALPGQINAATIDHGLRPASADEAAMVADWCAGQGIPHQTLQPATSITGNVQSAARAVRYALLERWRIDNALDVVMTAHHADDQLETLLMRLNRGSGVAGLSGVRARASYVVRPLLGWRKADLLALAETHGLPFVHDPSNSDSRFDRAALRKHLAVTDWLDPIAATRSAAALAEAEDALTWIINDLAAQHCVKEGEGWRLTATAFPREIQRRLLLYMLFLAAPDARQPRGDALDGALAQLNAGGKAMLGDWLLTGGDHWTLRPAPPRRSPPRSPPRSPQ